MLRSILLSIIIFASVQAQAFFSYDLKTNVELFEQHAQAQAIGTLELPWVVGEKANYSLNMAIFTGTMVVEVVSDEGNAFWVHQDTELVGNKSKAEMLIDKETGELLEVRVNGQKQDLPENNESEILEQKEESITVPAGTYDCIYVKIRSEGRDSEMWVNPFDVPVFGMLKQVSPTQFGPMTLELTEFTDL